MDRNLTEQLRKLSSELAQALTIDTADFSDDEAFALDERIEDIRDEILEIEETIREDADYEYRVHSAKGWN